MANCTAGSSRDTSKSPAPRKPRAASAQRKPDSGRTLSKTLATVAVSSFVSCSVAAIRLRNTSLAVITICLTAMIAAAALVAHMYDGSQDERAQNLIVVIFAVVILLIVGIAGWIALNNGVPWIKLVTQMAAWSATTAVVWAGLLKYINRKTRRRKLLDGLVASRACPQLPA